jgi:hypothetical protein
VGRRLAVDIERAIARNQRVRVISAEVISPTSLLVDGTSPVSVEGARWVNYPGAGGEAVLLLNDNGMTVIGLSDIPWIPVTGFQNGWANYGGAFQPAQYRKIGDMVHLRGLIRNETGVNGPIPPAAFYLPPGFRPPAIHLLVGLSSGTTTGAASTGTAHTHPLVTYGTRVEIKPTGEVIPWVTGANGYCALESVSFSITP